MNADNRHSGWITDSSSDTEADNLMRRVDERRDQRGWTAQGVRTAAPVAVVKRLRQDMIESRTTEGVQIREQYCDVIPRDYTIDWRIPILGPIHALVRRLINAEIRRYLMPALEKQSYLNRQFLRTLNNLRDENDRLRRRIEELQEENPEGPAG